MGLFGKRRGDLAPNGLLECAQQTDRVFLVDCLICFAFVVVEDAERAAGGGGLPEFSVSCCNMLSLPLTWKLRKRTNTGGGQLR